MFGIIQMMANKKNNPLNNVIQSHKSYMRHNSRLMSQVSIFYHPKINFLLA